MPITMYDPAAGYPLQSFAFPISEMRIQIYAVDTMGMSKKQKSGE